MKIGPAVHHRKGIFGHLLVDQPLLLPPGGLDRIFRTNADAATAADTAGVIDLRLSVAEGRCVVGTDAGAGMAADAERAIHRGLAVAVLRHLSCAGTASHAEIFDRAAESGHFMPLEVVERNDDIGVHDGAPDPRLLEQFAVRHRHGNIVGPLEAVADDDVTAGRVGRKSVEISGLDMFESVFPGADIEGIAVGEEGAAAALLDLVRDGAGEVGAQEREVARLAEVNFNRGETILKIDRIDSGPFDQCGEFLLEVLPFRTNPHIGEIYFCFFHGCLFDEHSIRYRVIEILASRIPGKRGKLFSAARESCTYNFRKSSSFF